MNVAAKPRTRHPVITIDGPAGGGKSTAARRLAERLGFVYLSSGAIYRVVAWCARGGMPVPEVLARTRIEFRGRPTAQRVLVDGQDVTEALGTPEVGVPAAVLSQRPEVRAFADEIQRRVATTGPVVVEGRDAGTVVFPEADCKFYLDASLDARARRRLNEHQTRGDRVTPEAVREALAARDTVDQTRALAPLCRTPDATYIDSSDLTVDEVVELMVKEAERACSTHS